MTDDKRNTHTEHLTAQDADDELLLEQFFQAAREEEIEDRGFSQQVMRQLPDRSLLLSRWWTALCVCLGLVLFVVFRGWQAVSSGVSTLVVSVLTDVKPVPLFVTIGVFCCLTLIEVAQQAMLWQENYGKGGYGSNALTHL